MTSLLSFEEFTAYRRQTQSNGDSVLFDASETRFAAAVQPQLRDLATLRVPDVGYRCHVAEQWLECFGLPADWKARVLVSQGVRDSLRSLFRHAADRNERWLLPSDVYPVYGQLASEAGLEVAHYASMPTGLTSVPDGIDAVLVTNPFKPRGTSLQPLELAALTQWLSGDSSRRVVIDAVYTFARSLDAATQVLMATGQAVVLHSLSKGWGRPLLAGIALVPPADVGRLTPVFRALPVDRTRLGQAHALLEQERGGPDALRRWLALREMELKTQLKQQGIRLMSPDTTRMRGAYLFLVQEPWDRLLSRNVLALPASVFGSTLQGLSVVSSLPPLPLTHLGARARP